MSGCSALGDFYTIAANGLVGHPKIDADMRNLAACRMACIFGGVSISHSEFHPEMRDLAACRMAYVAGCVCMLTSL